jgi:hypothetical protein
MGMSMSALSEQSFRERECVHRARGVEGCFYSGASYVQSLQRLRASAAADFSARVASFFGRAPDRRLALPRLRRRTRHAPARRLTCARRPPRPEAR